MKARPTIFLSGVSHEFGRFRDAVENEIEMKGCFAENQPGFPPDYHTVEEMLRRKLHDADAVIHIVGFRFGSEPNQRPVNAQRRSYAQMEFDIAREIQKPVYVFLSTDSSVRDEPKPEEKPQDAESTELQLAHREAVQKTNHLFYFFKDKAELCKLVAEIPQVETAEFHADISRIDRYAPAELIGREAELALLSDAWKRVRRAVSPRAHVITLVALGGEGKTSLVAKWAAGLAAESWQGCDAAFAWSFYSQGTREQMAASSDLFLKEALTFFGDPDMANSAQGAFDKGRRLAQLVGERRALLILDGLEPLQYAPTSPQPGELKDQGISALLKGLVATSLGLCVVTTRYSVTDLKNYWQTSAPNHELLSLSREAGVVLLKSLGVNGSRADFQKLVEDVKGHALTLNLLGSYLRDAHGGDIRKRDLVKLEEANAEEQGGHAFHVMDAYVKWFETGGKNYEENSKGQRALVTLRLLGLFDRPASADCLTSLKQPPVIPGLTEALVGTTEAQRNIVFSRLEDAKLLTVNRDAAATLVSVDAHPLLREYFAQRLRTQRPAAWRAAHQRLYKHLCETTKDKPQATLEDLQPLYQAVAHGCQAGLQQEACDEVYFARVRRQDKDYVTKKLGAFGADLGAVACFFEQPWSRLSPSLTEANQAWLLNEAALRLRALGRLTEALEPMRIGLEMGVRQKHWKGVAIRAGNLSELELTLGEVAEAVEDAEHSVTYADRGGDTFQRITSRATLADALNQAGRWEEAKEHFREAGTMQAWVEPRLPLLYSLAGFQYCDLLLATAERAAWQSILEGGKQERHQRGRPIESAWPALPSTKLVDSDKAVSPHRPVSPAVPPHWSAWSADALQICDIVSQFAGRTRKWVERANLDLLSIALDDLTLGRVAFYTQILLGSPTSQPTMGRLGSYTPLPTDLSHITAAVDGLRRAGQQFLLPRGLLARGWMRSVTGPLVGPESAQSDLNEAWEIAERGPMRLHMADIHLYRARLFHAVQPYPWGSDADGHTRGPRDDLAAARKLIEACGYWRRKEELEDAEAVAVNW